MMLYLLTGEAAAARKKMAFFACHYEAYTTLRTVYMRPKLSWCVWHGHWADPGDQHRNRKLPERLPQRVLHLYWYVHVKGYAILYVPYGHQGEFLIRDKTYHFCYQKDCTGFMNVSVHLCLCYDTSRAHRRGCVAYCVAHGRGGVSK